MPGVVWVAGRPAPADRSILLTDEEALFDLLLGRIVLAGSGTIAPVDPAIEESDALLMRRGGLERRLLVEELMAFLRTKGVGGASLQLSSTTFATGAAKDAILAAISAPEGWRVEAETTFGGRAKVSGRQLLAAQGLNAPATGSIRLRATSPDDATSVVQSFAVSVVGAPVADTVAPIVTSPKTFTVAENTSFETTLVADETVTWAKVAGADAALFTLDGAKLSLAARDYEAPSDADANNVYRVNLTATDAAGNVTPFTIDVTVANVLEGALPTITPTSATIAPTLAAGSLVLDLPAKVEGEARSFLTGSPLATDNRFTFSTAGKLIVGAEALAGGTINGTVRQTREGQTFDTAVTITVALPMGRPMLASSRLQALSSRVQVTSSDTYKMRYIAEWTSLWTEYGRSFALAAWYGNEQPLGNDWPIKAMVLEVNDVKYNLTYNGQEAFTISDGTAIWTDELPVVIPANSVIRVGVADELAVGQYRPSQGPVFLPRSVVQTSSGRGDAILSSGTASQVSALKSNTGEGFTNTPGIVIMDGLPIMSTARPYGTASIAQATAGLKVGDSIGWGDRTQGMPFGILAEDLGASGFLGHAFNTLPGGRIPFANLCVPGTRLPDLTLSPTPVGVQIKGFDKRRALLEAKGWPYDFILCEMGLNSATNGTATSVVADAKAAHAQLKSMGSKRVIQTLLLPCSVSKDEGTNADNAFLYSSPDASKQVRQAGASIDAFNAYIKGTPSDVDGYIELASAIESSPGSGKFAAVANQQGRLTADAASGQKVVTVNFAVQPGDGIILNPGDTTQAEAKDIQSVVNNGNGTWTLTFRQNLAKAHTANTDTGVVTAAGIYTFDGIHVVTQAARRLKERMRANALQFDPRRAPVPPSGSALVTINSFEPVTVGGEAIFVKAS
ncbi:hypothetical protein [Aureimonas sp. AU40]|uniref:hypothetical protein n=1 Tax=Aureimonas sp. AU40 TaxID=1637747 RepID=UPI0007814C8B|nr:hypothetical protein [Aureimonas sp. AU40]